MCESAQLLRAIAKDPLLTSKRSWFCGSGEVLRAPEDGEGTELGEMYYMAFAFRRVDKVD